MTCVVCDKRPAREGAYCTNCASKVKAERNRHKPKQAFRYLTYRDIVVGMYSNGNGTLMPVLLKRNPKYLPKGITLNLDKYLDGYTRQQIKRMKSVCLRLANV